MLEKKGLLTKQKILEAIRELRRKNPQAKTPLEFDGHPDPTFPEPYLPTETADAIITQIFDLLSGQKLAVHQAKALLHRCLHLVDLGERLGKKTTHQAMTEEIGSSLAIQIHHRKPQIFDQS